MQKAGTHLPDLPPATCRATRGYLGRAQRLMWQGTDEPCGILYHGPIRGNVLRLFQVVFHSPPSPDQDCVSETRIVKLLIFHLTQSSFTAVKCSLASGLASRPLLSWELG